MKTYFQAYAESETDTPGTIFGITQKPDGKSKSRSFANETKTQGETDSTYEKQDRSGDEEYQRMKRFDYNLYKVAGLTLVMVLFLNLLNTNENSLKYSYILARQRGIKVPGDEQDA